MWALCIFPCRLIHPFIACSVPDQPVLRYLKLWGVLKQFGHGHLGKVVQGRRVGPVPGRDIPNHQDLIFSCWSARNSLFLALWNIYCEGLGIKDGVFFCPLNTIPTFSALDFLSSLALACFPFLRQNSHLDAGVSSSPPVAPGFKTLIMRTKKGFTVLDNNHQHECVCFV